MTRSSVMKMPTTPWRATACAPKREHVGRCEQRGPSIFVMRFVYANDARYSGADDSAGPTAFGPAPGFLSSAPSGISGSTRNDGGGGPSPGTLSASPTAGCSWRGLPFVPCRVTSGFGPASNGPNCGFGGFSSANVDDDASDDDVSNVTSANVVERVTSHPAAAATATAHAHRSVSPPRRDARAPR